MHQTTKKLPTWCKEIRIQEILASTDEELEMRGGMQRSSSVNIPVESVKERVKKKPLFDTLIQ